MSIIGEALLSAAINALFDKLASTDLLQFARQEQIHVDLKKWEKILRQTYRVLDDAEERQITDRFVKDWLDELRNLTYDVEDILDEFATEALRRKLVDEPQPQSSTRSKVRKLIPTCCISSNPESIKFNVKMGSEIKEITDRLEKIVEQKNNLDLKDNLGGKSYKVGYRRLPATSLNETHICGRENDKEAILDMLFKDEGTSSGGVAVNVISIFGMGGLGKTTLAQLVYNDVRVDNQFDIKAWAYISDDFDIARVTKTILQSIDPGTSDVNDLNMLQVELRKKLVGKKFFIVLDDVWNENYEEWTMLCRPFEDGSSGSKIVITTRNYGVASMVGSHSAYQLKGLSDDNCFSIFTYHSLGKADFSEHQDLKEIGEKIVKRCNGLPLAAKTLGGLLRGKVRRKDWEDVSHSKIWNLPEESCGIIPALRVSYYYLPPHLKRCFAYCSIFPKDYVFEKEEIILLWMAEGFLQTDCSEKQAEDIGEDFFENLHARSFFQQFSSYSSKFVMHDLINDLAQWAAENFCFRVENVLEGEKHLKIPENLRHLSYVNSGSKYDGFNEIKSIRTFLPLPQVHIPCDFHIMLLQLQRLRVLSLKRYLIYELPNTISDLKHLRYLDLSYTEIENLPDSINTLYNLETLKLKGCGRLKNLCPDIGNLVNLRHLYISYLYSLRGMPSRIGRLVCLRTLPVYIVGKDIGFRLKELKNLTHLRGRLHISGLENVNDVEDAKEANFIGKTNLLELELVWTSSFSDSRNIEIETQVLDMLRPYQNLEKLTIISYGGAKFPSWLGITSFSNLVLLRFENCKNCTSLPTVGQLALLKDLFIKGLAGIKSIGPEFYGNGCLTPFQSLENLHIEDMLEWKDWIHLRFGKDSAGFPRLRMLSIEECPKLIGNLPENLPSLESLCIRSVGQMQMFIPSLPKHWKIEILKCKEVSWSSTVNQYSSLNSVVLSDISGGVFLAEMFLQGLSKVERIEIVGYKYPTSFWQIGVNSLEHIRSQRPSDLQFHLLMSFMEEERKELEQGLACRLKYLALRNCECLMKLQQLSNSLGFLRGISIEDCPELVSIPETTLPSELRFIVIKKCNALKSLPMSWMHSSNTSLEILSIQSCDSLAYVARVQLPPNLKKLEILYCSSLQTLVNEEEVALTHEENVNYLKNISCRQSRGNLPETLKHLYILGCSKLESIAESFYGNTSLETLKIEQCKSLEVLPNDLHNLSHLQQFSISNCLSLVPYPEWQLPSVNLKTLGIEYCEKLDTLPSSMNNLTSLQSLSIRSCPGVLSFPEDCFPTNLTSLSIGDANICKAFFDWGLHKLTSLKELYIWKGCPDVISFPQEDIGMMLPTSLTTLHIVNFPNLERLSISIQNPTSLEGLHLYHCPKLKFFPEKGLPPSLLRLHIYGCPLLRQSCETDTGLYWPMIALVPSVAIFPSSYSVDAIEHSEDFNDLLGWLDPIYREDTEGFVIQS